MNEKSDYTIDWSNVIHLTEMPNWQNVTRVYCRNCPNLKELPCWPNVEYVNCNNCPLLTELPNWPKVIEVSCYDCPGLTIFPNWHRIKNIWSGKNGILKSINSVEMTVYNGSVVDGKIDHVCVDKKTKITCSNCEDLEELPNWSSVTHVYCFNCPKLTMLPNWPSIKYVDCSNCPGITHLPNWSNIEEIYCHGTILTKLFRVPKSLCYLSTCDFILRGDIKYETVGLCAYKQFYQNYASCVAILQSSILPYDLKRLLIFLIKKNNDSDDVQKSIHYFQNPPSICFVYSTKNTRWNYNNWYN